MKKKLKTWWNKEKETWARLPQYLKRLPKQIKKEITQHPIRTTKEIIVGSLLILILIVPLGVAQDITRRCYVEIQEGNNIQYYNENLAIFRTEHLKEVNDYIEQTKNIRIITENNETRIIMPGKEPISFYMSCAFNLSIANVQEGTQYLQHNTKKYFTNLI